MNNNRQKQNLKTLTSMENTIGGWVLMGRPRKLIFTNELRILLGIGDDENIGPIRLMQRMEKWCQPVFRKVMRDCLFKKIPFDLKLQFRMASGKIRWIQIAAFAITDDNGLVSCQGTFRLVHNESIQTTPLQVLQVTKEILALKLDTQKYLHTLEGYLEIIGKLNWFPEHLKCQLYILESNGFVCHVHKNLNLETLPADVQEHMYSMGSTIKNSKQFRFNSKERRFDLPLICDSKVIGHLAMYLKKDIELDPLLVDGFLVIGSGLAKSLANFQTKQHLQIAQNQIVNSERLASLGEMSGGVAHEINNPLAIIDGYTKHIRTIIEESNGQVDVGELSELFHIVEKTVDRIVKIADGLRRISRNGSVDAIEPTLLSDILDDTLVLCQQRFKNQGIKIEVAEYSKDVMVVCRSIELSQVLVNLLNNSYDAIFHEDKKWIRIVVSKQGDSIIISVIDSGHGIGEDLRNKIMQPFFTTKEIGVGTGLGLSISTGILKKMGGELQIDTTSDNTKFDIILPSEIENGVSDKAS